LVEREIHAIASLGKRDAMLVFTLIYYPLAQPRQPDGFHDKAN